MTTQTTASASGRIRRSVGNPRRRWRFRSGYLLIVPYVICLLVFGIGPAIYAFVISFADFEMGRPKLFQAGLQNYVTAFTDHRFGPSFRNVFQFVALSLPVGIIGVVLLSLLLHARSGPFSTAMRTIYFLPGAITGPALVLVAIFMFDPVVSPFGWLLRAMGFETMVDVIRPNHLTILFTIVGFFGGAGGWIAIFYGGLNSISEEVLEAATMDGCNAWQLARYIKAPLIMPYIWYMLILVFAGNVQIFAQPQLIGSAVISVGIDPYWSVNQLGYWYAFRLGNFGGAAVISLVLVAIGLAAAFVIIKYSGFYETDVASG